MNVSKVCHSSAEIYDPVTEKFTEIGSLRYSSCSVRTTLLDNGSVLTTRNRPVELFDYRVMRFISTGKMMIVRGEPTATLLSNGQVLIAGGWQDGGERSATAEIYDPKSGTFFAVDNMSTERSGHAATLLPNGWVLVVGGCCGASSAAELFIPSSLP